MRRGRKMNFDGWTEWNQFWNNGLSTWNVATVDIKTTRFR